MFRKRSLLQSQKLVRREREKRFAKSIVFVILLVALVWGISALTYASKINVQNILVSGNSVVSKNEVISIARDSLKGSNFWIFSRANILWFPKQEIIDFLQYSYSWIDTVEIDRVNLSTIEIKIKERAPVAVWCGKTQEKTRPCKLLDAQGYIFAKAPEFAGAAYLKLYGPLTSASWKGPGFYSLQGLQHILEFTKDLPEIGFQPLAATVINATSYDVYLNSGTRISAQISDPVPVVISNIDSLLTQKVFAQSQLNNFSNLLYIDARFGNKLFYKFK